MTHGSEIVRREPLATGLSATDRDRVRRALAAALAPNTRRAYLGTGTPSGPGDGCSGHSPRVGMPGPRGRRICPARVDAGRPWSTSAMPALYVRAQSAGHGAVAKYYAESTNDSPETREAAS